MGSHQASGNSGANLPAYNRVFGLSLDELFRRDETAVPLVVYQCIQAIDLFGLEVQGIYRQSGSANHVHQLKAQFDHGNFAIFQFLLSILQQVDPEYTVIASTKHICYDEFCCGEVDAGLP